MKTIIVLFIVAVAAMFLGGCSGTMKSETIQTVNTVDANGNPVSVVTKTDTTTPKDIAHEDELVDKHATCRRPVQISSGVAASLGLIRPMELKSGAAQAEYIEAVSDGQLIALTQMAIANMAGDPEAACHEAISKEAAAYYMMEAKRSSNRWGFGKFLAGTAAAYLIVSDWSSTLASAASNGDINIGSINQTKSDDPSTGGEGGGSLNSEIGGQVINIGSGQAGTDRAIPFTAEKGIGFSGDSNMDADGAPAGTTGVSLSDDDGENSGSLF